MAHPQHHAESSARKYGGEASDYIGIHTWLHVIWTIKCFCFPDWGLSWLSIGGTPPPAPRSAGTRAAERAAGRCLWATATFSVPVQLSVRLPVPRQ